MYIYLAVGGGAVHLPCGVFNMLIGQTVFNAVRLLGNTALINGIGTSNKSLGAIIMYTALLLGWRKYVRDQDSAL